MEKYELLPNDYKAVWFVNRKYRIQAIRDFGNVRAGDLGGYIEKEENLSHVGEAWVYGNAWVSDNAQISGNARISDNTNVCGKARVSDNAWVSDNVLVSGYACVSDNAQVYGNAQISGNARISGNTHIFGNARVTGNAEIRSDEDIFWVSNIGSHHGTTTIYRGMGDTVLVTCGCFFGTLEKFEIKVKETHGDNQYGVEYQTVIELAKIRFGKQKEAKQTDDLID